MTPTTLTKIESGEKTGGSIMWYDNTEQLALFKTVVLGGSFSDDEMKLALGICKQTGLNPITKQIYFVKRGSKMTVQTGIDGFRSLAEETGEFAGSDDYLFDEGLTQFMMLKTGRSKPVTATAVVYRMVKGQRVPFAATAAWDSYYPGPQFTIWGKMPFLMLGKCAEALALRKAFPQRIGGLYTDDEMAQAGPPAEAPAPIQTPQRKTTAAVPPVTTATVVQKAEEKHDQAKANAYQPEPLVVPDEAPTQTAPPPPPPAPAPSPKPQNSVTVIIDNYPDKRKITEPQRKRFYAIYHKNGWSDDQAKELCLSLNIMSSTLIPMDMYEDICEIVSKPPAAKA